MTLPLARAVPVAPAREVAARFQVVATRRRPPRRIRAQGGAVADAVAGEGAEEVVVNARIRRLHLRPRVDRRTVAGLHLLPLVLGVSEEAIRDGLGPYQGHALRAGAWVKTEATDERRALGLGHDPLSEIRSRAEIGAGAGVSVAADRLLDAVESGIDLFRRQEVQAAAEAAVEVESRVDRALQKNATRSGVGAGLGLLPRKGDGGVPGVVVMTVTIGIQSGAGGAPEVDLILVLLPEDVGILVADLSCLIKSWVSS